MERTVDIWTIFLTFVLVFWIFWLADSQRNWVDVLFLLGYIVLSLAHAWTYKRMQNAREKNNA